MSVCCFVLRCVFLFFFFEKCSLSVTGTGSYYVVWAWIEDLVRYVEFLSSSEWEMIWKRGDGFSVAEVVLLLGNSNSSRKIKQDGNRLIFGFAFIARTCWWVRIWFYDIVKQVRARTVGISIRLVMNDDFIGQRGLFWPVCCVNWSHIIYHNILRAAAYVEKVKDYFIFNYRYSNETWIDYHKRKK